MANGVEHAYRDRVPDTVEVELEITAGQPRVLTARVRDHGRWRPVPARPGHRGRGLAMIDSLTRDMRVTSDARGTEVAFTLPLSG
jgi:anti-sigma regulatory factor (Ser/Thr protein kinase)